MKTLSRVVLWVAGAVFALAVVVAIALKLFIDPNDYRDDIASAVEDATGRTLNIEGELSLEIFPQLGIGLGPIELSNPPGFAGERFVRVENASVSVRVLPLLLRQELMVGRVQLEGLDLDLISLADGRTNWDFSAADAAPDAAGSGPDAGAPQSEPQNAEESAVAALSALNVAGIDISGRVSYTDEATGDALEIADLQLSTSSIRPGEPFKLEAAVQVNDLAPDTVVQLKLESDAVLNLAASTLGLENSALSAKVSAPELPGGEAKVDLRLNEVRDLGAETFSFAGLAMQLRAAGVTVKIDGNGSVTGSAPAIDGNFSVGNFSPRELLQTLGEPPLETSDPAVLANASLDAAFNVNGDTAELNVFSLKFDDTTGAGQFRLASIESMSMELDLQFDSINLDRYTAPVVEGEVAGQGGGQGGGTTDDALDLPVEDLRALQLRGRLGFDELQVADVDLKRLNVRIAAQDGVIRLAPVRANVFGGRYTDKIRLDVTSDVPKIALKSDLQGIRIGRLLAKMQDIRNVEGVADVNLDVRSTGLTETAMLENLKGMISVNMEDGRYKGTDLWYELRAAKARIKKDELPPPPENPSTDISKFSGSARLSEGVLRNRDFLALIPFIQLEGAGEVNYLESTLDYELQAKITGEKKFNDGYTMEELDGVAVPVRLTGNIEAPKITVDMNTVLQSLAQRKAKERLMDKLDLNEKSDKKSTSKSGKKKSSRDETKDQIKEGLRKLLD